MEEEIQLNNKKNKKKNFRKRRASDEDHYDEPQGEQETRMALEEVKLLQKQRQRKLGIPAMSNGSAANLAVVVVGGGNSKNSSDKKSINKVTDSAVLESGSGSGDVEKDKDDLVLQDTFAQETAVMVEDPNMLKYVEQELAKKRGRKIDSTQDQVDNDLKRAEDDLYKIPDHLKVKKRNSEESSTQWTTGIAEVQLPIEYKLRNIEETEAAKKLLQEKRLIGRTKSDFTTIPSSYSADYFQRGRDYAEKLRREHPELYKDRSSQDGGGAGGSRQHDTATDTAPQRQAATDEFMLERFRKRERLRVMRR